MYKQIKRITICALLVALGVIFSRFLSIPFTIGGSYGINLGFGMLPILLLCVLYGPVYGSLGAVLWDLIGAILFPNGAFVVWFTLAAGVLGLIVGAFFSSNEDVSPLRLAIAILCGQFAYSVFLNSTLISVLYGVPFMALLVPRLIENVIMVVINSILVYILVGIIKKANLLPERFAAKEEISD